ncbi:MAG: hypothetical protein K1Y02_09025 [Candidatus Hydrogenedentes bacterium]|nr:hypothetical protein [Candidatus Hydrogenedentota bacterium]
MYQQNTKLTSLICLVIATAFLCVAAPAQNLDLSSATVCVDGNRNAARVAATVLSEEVEKRCGLKWQIVGKRPSHGTVIEVLVESNVSKLSDAYRIETSQEPDSTRVRIVGASKRGALFGVGYLLRKLEWRPGTAYLPHPINVSASPEYAIRGHQLGYRATANSYDAWTPEQYDQYIRELALFGTNAIETIPIQDERPTVGSTPRQVMDRAVSASCDKYGLDYWIWTPASFDLNDTALRAKALDEHEEAYKGFKRLDAVFFPGGDPGDNPPELVMPFLEDVSKRLIKYHPKAKVWVSLQGFTDAQVDVFYAWMEEHKPTWLGGVVAGPSSPSISETRLRLDKRYGIRHYPDITHVIRAQYAVPWIDPAFAFTLGREPVNPRPVFYRTVHNNLAPYTNGFLTYSDGIHDDVNKVVWSSLGWNTQADLREILTDYARLFFGPDVAETAADGIFALEKNWEGSLANNGGVDATLALWKGIEEKSPQLSGNWRWQLCLLRAYYDTYVRHRLINESGLEEEANARMLEASTAGSEKAIDAALAALARVDTAPVRPELRQRIVDLCEALWQSIGLQTSVEKYKASGAERGAVLDYVDYPLNNRWWLEDELAKVRALPDETSKVARLRELAMWEHPGTGSFYDDIGNVAQCDHVIRSEAANTLLDPDRAAIPDFMWWDSGKRRVRQSWMSKMDWPDGLRYMGLDPNADYVFRTTGVSSCLPRANGVRLIPTQDGREVGDIKEFPVPRRAYREGNLTITFDIPFEPGINWRQMSRISEAWLIKK